MDGYNLPPRDSLGPYLQSILQEMHTVLVERGSSYSDISHNSVVFAGIMRAMGVVTPSGMTDTDFHCMAMTATKMARWATGSKTHEDTHLDSANYWVLMLAELRRVKQEAMPLPPLFSDDVQGETFDSPNDYIASMADRVDAAASERDKFQVITGKGG